MDIKVVKHELQNIIQGKSSYSENSLIQTVACYLRTSQSSSTVVKDYKQYKQKETESLANNFQGMFKNGVLYFIDTVFYIK